MNRHLTSWARTLAAVGVLGGVVLGGLTPVRADEAPSGTTATATVAPSPSICQDPPCRPPTPSIHCVLRIQQYPFHLPPPLGPPPGGQIGVVPELTCTDSVPQLTFDVSLLRNGNYVDGDVVHGSNLDSMARPLWVPCQAGTWMGVANVNGHWPAGYTPATFSLHVHTWNRNISC